MIVKIGFGVLLIGFAAGCWGDGIGGIRGEVKLVGSAPVMLPQRVSGDRVCEEFHATKPIMQKEVVAGKEGTLQNVVVWISEGWPGDRKPVTPVTGKASLVQQGCEFIPHVMAVQVGQAVEVKNVDPTIHNVNVQPEINEKFNFVLLPDGKPVNVEFKKPEVAVMLRNDIHPWMTAWVAVFDHSAFDVTGEDGRFEIGNLPAGEYTLDAWHEKLGRAQTEVLVKEGAPAEVTFTFTVTGAGSGAQEAAASPE